MRINFISFLLIFIILLLGCNSAKNLSKKIIKPVLEAEQISDIQKEIDDIFSLLIYSLVYQDWQPESMDRKKRRGYNIGALLVDAKNEPVYFGLNSINSTENATQHGEVIAITNYLEKTKKFNLSGFTIYTTLEPCIMCAGMITMTAIKRAVHGQNDIEYSKAFERLAIDTRPIGGFPPYPRKVITQASSLAFRTELDKAYAEFLEHDEEKVLAKFLASETARTIYERTHNAFTNYQVIHKENAGIYTQALVLLNETQKNYEKKN